MILAVKLLQRIDSLKYLENIFNRLCWHQLKNESTKMCFGSYLGEIPEILGTGDEVDLAK